MKRLVFLLMIFMVLLSGCKKKTPLVVENYISEAASYGVSVSIISIEKAKWPENFTYGLGGQRPNEAWCVVLNSSQWGILNKVYFAIGNDWHENPYEYVFDQIDLTPNFVPLPMLVQHAEIVKD